MSESLITKLFFNEDKDIRRFAIKYLIANGRFSPDLIKTWFESIKKFGYKSGDIDVRELFVFFNFSNKNADENFKHLIDFYKLISSQSYGDNFFFLIYMSSIEIQNKFTKDLKMILNDEEYQIIEEGFKEYESFKNYKLDELFLVLINLLEDSDELDFMELNHRLIETIIDLIVKFPAGEVSAFMENIITENIEHYYLNSYLFYINAQLKGFINSDDLMKIILDRSSVIKYQILEQSFFIRPIKELAYKLIEKDFQYIKLLKYFSEKEIINFFHEMKEIYEEKELFLEYFVELFSITLCEYGVELSKSLFEKGFVRNKDVKRTLNLASEILLFK
jgi:hypothetical protein